jgi:FKBP-type peptidyl-prolyl cis-trans isomerase
MILKHFSLLIYFILFFTILGCKTYNKEDKLSFDQKIKTIVTKSNKKYKRSESGLYYFIEKQGEGKNIKFTDEVTFNYTGKLINGKVFDGEHKKNPVTFKVEKLIEGWKEAMLYLKKGAKAKVIIPPYLGYGDYELDHIPPHSILLFDLEIIDIK